MMADIHHSPLTPKNINLMNEAWVYDIITSHQNYHNMHNFADHIDCNSNGNAYCNNNSCTGDLELRHSNPNVNLAGSELQQQPHTLVGYGGGNNNSEVAVGRHGKARDNFRSNSPRGYESDESCTSYSSRGTPPGVNNRNHKCNNHHNRIEQLNQQNSCFARFSHHHSPPILHAHFYQQSDIPKNRYFSHSPGRTKHSHQSKHMDVMVRRAHGLMERFKSRSHLMKINRKPKGLLTGGPWDQLNQTIWDLFSSNAQKEDTYIKKLNLWKSIFLYIRKCLNSYGLFMVGSTMSGFGLEGSDIDMCLLTKPFLNDPRVDSLHHLGQIRQLLLRSGLAVDAGLIMAKVPILKFRNKETGFEIDLNCNNSVGIRNTHLLHTYALLDWRVRPLVVVVKLWAQANYINDAKNMTISSYSWALMVIHYLQCGVTPSVLPCLHGLVPEKFNSDSEHHSMDVQEEIDFIRDFESHNTSCLGDLLIGFLHYYSYFNYAQYAISVRAGCRLPIDECRFLKSPKNDPNQWKCLCIEEPFDFSNTARSVFDVDVFQHIKTVIMCSYKELARNKTLNDVMPVNTLLNRQQR